MDQTSIFAATEDDVYAKLEPSLLELLDANWASREPLRLDRRKAYCSIVYGNSVVARLTAAPGASLSILKGQAPIPGAVEDGNFYRLSLPDLAEAQRYVPQLREALQQVLDRTPKEFSCCGRYLECSNQRACTNPDREMALRCGYRKALRDGRIFYGKNRNIDAEI